MAGSTTFSAEGGVSNAAWLRVLPRTKNPVDTRDNKHGDRRFQHQNKCIGGWDKSILDFYSGSFCILMTRWLLVL